MTDPWRKIERDSTFKTAMLILLAFVVGGILYVVWPLLVRYIAG